MNSLTSKLIFTGVFFLFIFLTGFWLRFSNKPYPVVVFTLHKLIALGALAFLAVQVYQTHQALPIQGVQVLVITTTALLFVITIISGGLASLEKTMPAALLLAHKVLPYLTAVSVGITLYLVLFENSPITSQLH